MDMKYILYLHFVRIEQLDFTRSYTWSWFSYKLNESPAGEEFFSAHLEMSWNAADSRKFAMFF